MKKQNRRELRLEKKFVPVAADVGDELFPNGIFEFNITKMLLFINAHPAEFVPEPVVVGDYAGKLSSIGQDVLDSIDSTDPVVLAEISPGRYNLIDGHHRMERARRAGLEHVMGYRLKMEQHIRFLATHNAYAAYVEYRNGKLKDIYVWYCRVFAIGIRFLSIDGFPR